MKNKRVLKRVLPFTLACVATITLSSGCQNKNFKNNVSKSISIVEYNDNEKVIDGLACVNSENIKVLEIYDQINEKTDYYFFKPMFKFELDNDAAKNIALLRFSGIGIEDYIKSETAKYSESGYESVFKNGTYLWIDSLTVDTTSSNAEHTYINIKGDNFYHIDINFFVKKANVVLKENKQVYTRLNDKLYSNQNEVFKIKVSDFEDMYEKGFYSYEELETLIANLNINNSRKLTNN